MSPFLSFCSKLAKAQYSKEKKNQPGIQKRRLEQTILNNISTKFSSLYIAVNYRRPRALDLDSYVWHVVLKCHHFYLSVANWLKHHIQKKKKSTRDTKKESWTNNISTKMFFVICSYQLQEANMNRLLCMEAPYSKEKKPGKKKSTRDTKKEGWTNNISTKMFFVICSYQLQEANMNRWLCMACDIEVWTFQSSCS